MLNCSVISGQCWGSMLSLYCQVSVIIPSYDLLQHFSIQKAVHGIRSHLKVGPSSIIDVDVSCISADASMLVALLISINMSSIN